ncbi:MAG: hypothetical protein ACREQ5_35825, partial [Candidatus Dormibacteria bacterium]
MTLSLPTTFSAPAVTGAVLAQQPTPPPKDPGGQGEAFGKSSPAGLVVLLLLLVVVALLVRSMNKHLRRVPQSFDKPRSFDKPESIDDDN